MSSIALAGRTCSREEQVKPRRRPNHSRVFVVVIAVLLLVLAGEIVFHLVVAPRLVVRNVRIISDAGLSLDDASLLSIAKLTERAYYFEVDPASIAGRLESYPLIKEATVEKVFPDTLRIHVIGRKPLAVSLVQRNGRSVPVAFDEEGVVFQIGESVTDLDLPVVSGLGFPDLELGRRVSRPLTEFLDELHELRAGEPLLFSLISEIKFVKKNRSGFEVVLYLRDYPIRVLLGSSLSSDLMKRIVLVLDVFSRQGVDDMREIDFRTNDIVMRVRGE